MDNCSPSDSVDPASLSVSQYSSAYPTPPTMSGEASPTPSTQQETSKKKRKAWGQPVPEIKQILPPRKRAKTAEEKEQRKNERILRNRRAADKSRQRQKAAVAELEANQGRIRQENAMLKDILAKYQTRFGVPDDIQMALTSLSEINDDLSAPSPLDLDDMDTDTPATTISYQPTTTNHPVFVQSDSQTPMQHESPALAPTLNLTEAKAEPEQSAQMGPYDFAPTSVVTQYPAAILCDLQCQTQVGATEWSPTPSSQPTFKLGLSQLLQTIQYLTIFQTFSTSTLLPMYQLFQILAQKLATASMEQTFPSILNSFPLIHSLISMPSTPTRPAVFRMKLLSRLLACSPHMARLLLAATDRALQRVVSEDAFAEDPDQRWTWSSLMTIKWTILRLEREHRKIRRQVGPQTTEKGQDLQQLERVLRQQNVMAGVDLGAVARSSRLWHRTDAHCNNRMDQNQIAPEVH